MSEKITRAINIYTETIISFEQAAKDLSTRGSNCNKNQIARWASRGRYGVVLPSVRLKGQRHTSKEALSWFLNQPSKRRRPTAIVVATDQSVNQECSELGI